MTSIATSYGADQLGSAAELTNGYQAAFIGAAAVAALGALVAAVPMAGRPPPGRGRPLARRGREQAALSNFA